MSQGALAVQRFLRARRHRIVPATPELWRRVRAMARGNDDVELVQRLVVEPGWLELNVQVDAPLPLLVRQLQPCSKDAVACACVLVAAGVLAGGVPPRAELLHGIAAGVSAYRSATR